MSIAKHVTFASLAASGLCLTGSTFAPGTAAAHCGEHSNSCGGYEDRPTGNGYCSYGDYFAEMETFGVWCNSPLPKDQCGGLPGTQCACADCAGECSQGTYWTWYNFC